MAERFARATPWRFRFPSDRFDAAVMALVIFFVPDPARGVAEMVRVVCPGGTVATYAWDMLGGGFPLEPIQVEMRAMGLTPVLPPSPGASRMDALRNLWTGAGLEAVETREITVQRTFADFDDFWTTSLLAAEHSPDGRRNGVRRCRTAQDTGARAPASRRRGPHHLQCTRQRDKGARASVITPPEMPGLWKRGLAFSAFETVGMDQTIMQGASRRTFRYKSRGDNELTDCREGLARGLRFFEPRSPLWVLAV